MKKQYRLINVIVDITFGIILLTCQFLGLVDEFWGGMGSAFLFVGILQIFKVHKYRTNESYRENVDTNAKDERNHFLAMKAWSWAGYLFVIISAAATIILRILGHNDMSFAASMAVCTVLNLYWISFIILKRKY